MNAPKIVRTIATVVLMAIVAVGCGNKSDKPEADTTLRVLYWNFQNGMWADQTNGYNNFAGWVSEYDPDICIWCEAQTIYKGSTNEKCAPEERYLVDNWGELAPKFGHTYWEKGGHRDNYPQVITSKYPIEVVEQIVGEEPDSVVTHGAGHFRVEFNGKKINIVTLHTWPQKYAYRAKDQQASKAENGGDKYRLKEMQYICEKTIRKAENAENELWLMAGDYNSQSRVDNHFYKWAEDDTRFLVHDYIRNNTPYIDIIAERFPGEFHTTTAGKSRIDFIYCTAPLYERIIDAYVVNDAWTKDPVRDEKTNFHYPSDHLPILVDYEMK